MPTCEFSILIMQEMLAQPGLQIIRSMATWETDYLPLDSPAWKANSIILDIAMEQITHYRQILNNYLQEVYRGDPRRRLTWETSHEGPDNRPTWQAIAFLNEVEWGRGNGPSRGAAMEAAAERVLIALGVQLQEA